MCRRFFRSHWLLLMGELGWRGAPRLGRYALILAPDQNRKSGANVHPELPEEHNIEPLDPLHRREGSLG